MTIKELIKELRLLNPNTPVCGESETANWDLTLDDMKFKEVTVEGNSKLALVIGYIH